MKKLLKSPLCVVAMGTTFFVNSNAARWSQLPGNIMLMDVNERMVTVGNPDNPTLLLENIRGFSELDWQGSKFRIFLLNTSPPQNIPYTNLYQFPADLRDQITDALNNQGGPVNDMFNKLMTAMMINTKRNQHVAKIQEYQQKLGMLAAEFNNKINSNVDVKGSLLITLTQGDLVEGKLDVEGYEILNIDQDTDNIQLQFRVPNKASNMSSEDYYQQLKKINEQWSTLHDALLRAYPFLFLPAPPQ